MKQPLEKSSSFTESTDVDVSFHKLSSSERIDSTERIGFFLPSPGSLKQRVTIGGLDTKELHRAMLRRSDSSGATSDESSVPMSHYRLSEFFSPMSTQRVSEIFVRERCEILFNKEKSSSCFVDDMQALFDSNELTEVGGNANLEELVIASPAASPKTSSSSTAKKKGCSCTVTFGELEIREYSNIPGDNPAGTKGPPLTIGWIPVSTVRIAHIDKYEEVRQRHRRTTKQLQMPAEQRTEILRSQGFARAEIQRSTKWANIARRQRRETISTLKYQALWEKVESMKRKAHNVLTLGRRYRAQKEYLKKYVPSYGVIPSYAGVVSNACSQ